MSFLCTFLRRLLPALSSLSLTHSRSHSLALARSPRAYRSSVSRRVPFLLVHRYVSRARTQIRPSTLDLLRSPHKTPFQTSDAARVTQRTSAASRRISKPQQPQPLGRVSPLQQLPCLLTQTPDDCASETSPTKSWDGPRIRQGGFGLLRWDPELRAAETAGTLCARDAAADWTAGGGRGREIKLIPGRDAEERRVRSCPLLASVLTLFRGAVDVVWDASRMHPIIASASYRSRGVDRGRKVGNSECGIVSSRRVDGTELT